MTQLFSIREAMRNEKPEKEKTFFLSWTDPKKQDKQRVLFKANDLTKFGKVSELLTDISKKVNIPENEIIHSFRRVV
jgi:hypothetical protein